MTRFLYSLSGCLLAGLLVTGCFFSGKRSNDSGLGDASDRGRGGGNTQVAWNAFGDPNWKSDVNGAIDRARQKVGRPGRNPDFRLPPVDLSRANSVSYRRVNVAGPYLAMTFDDGPHPTLTPRLLDILKKRNIRATFFVVGTNAKAYPQIIRRMVAEGHEVANHTVNHPRNMANMSQDRVRAELRGCEQSILSACGRKPRLMRPPGGSINSAQKVWIHDEFGYLTILWSCDPEDWKRPGVGVVTQRVIAGAESGAIILAHDIHAPTVAAMPAALDGILAKGYRFVTVSQLLSMEQHGPAVAAADAAADPAGDDAVDAVDALTPEAAAAVVRASAAPSESPPGIAPTEPAESTAPAPLAPLEKSAESAPLAPLKQSALNPG